MSDILKNYVAMQWTWIGWGGIKITDLMMIYIDFFISHLSVAGVLLVTLNTACQPFWNEPVILDCVFK